MNLLQMSFSGAVMILAIICIRCLTKNRIPKATFLALWYAALLRLLIPFSLEASFSVYSVFDHCMSYADPIYTADTIKGGAVLANTMTEMVSTNPSEPSGFSWWWLIWCVGAVACAVFFGVTYFRCFREFKISLPVDNEYSQKWLIEHPLRRAISIRYSDRITAPLTFGVLKPVILLPRSIDWENENTIHMYWSMSLCTFNVSMQSLSFCSLWLCAYIGLILWSGQCTYSSIGILSYLVMIKS